MKRMKKILITSMCLAMMGAAIVPVTGAIRSGKAADSPTWSEVNIETNYVRDDTLVIPDRSLSVGGNTYEASIKVEYPSGTTERVESGEFALSQPGQYTLIYEVKDQSSITYTETVEFLVADKLWSVSNPKSTVEYGKVGATNGLVVRLAKNDVLRFNKIIDLSDLDVTDTLVKAFVNPPMSGTYEFDKFVFTFTDATDPTQTLTIRGNRSSTNNQRFASYWTSAGPDQTLGGWDPNANTFANANPDGIRGRHAMNASFYAQTGKYLQPSGCEWYDASADQCAFTLTYDKNDVKTYINNTWIADHDNGEYYEKEPLWYGFPSNKVFLTVEARECAGESAGFCITELFGYDFTQENVFTETDAPELTVDVDEKYVSYENGSYNMIPTAVVGGNYPVPVASAFDTYSGDLKVETTVYYNYSSESGRQIRPIKDNSFLVNKAGKYTIVYKTRDAMGNTTEKLYWITAVSALENPLTLSVDEAAGKAEGVCGEKITVAPYETTGGSGDVNVTITASCGNTVLNVTDDYFIPEQQGAWTIEYVAKDFAGIKVSDSYTVNVALGSEPVFVDEPILPKFMVSGIEYEVPNVIAYDYSTGTKLELLADMVLIDANGEHTYVAGAAFTPVADENDPVITLKFTVGGAEYVKEIPAVMPIVKNGNRTMVYIDKMFVGENFTAERTGNGLKVLAKEDGNLSWLFANAVVAENAAITVKGIQGKSQYEAMKVTFTDYANENIAVTMYIENQASGLARVNFGDMNRELTKGFNLGNDANGTPMDTFVFSYKLNKFYVDNLAVGVATDDKGNPFNGFPSGRVYISTETVGAKADAGYFLKQFDNQIIGTSTADTTQPRIGISGSYGGMYNINDTYTIAPVFASDTVDASVTASLTVKTPKGAIVSDINGTPLNKVSADKAYVIKLAEYGQYMIEYESVDFNNRIGTASYAVNVFDRKAPRASIADTWSATAKLGDTVVLPEIYISDDSSSIAEMKVFRYVRNPYGKAFTFGQDYVVTAGGAIQYYRYSFTFNNVGKYTFINVVYDATGNQKIVEYVVTVEA